jgi:ABC-type transport system involved in multi-copper enzyme maturation permease subunit
MPQKTLTIARNTFIEAVRQPIFFVMIVICGVLQLFNTWSTGFSMGYSDSAEVSGDNKLLLDIGLATVLVCGMLLAAFVATAVVSREIENKTVLTVVSKPIGRPTVVLGKYLGVAASMLMALVPMLIFLLMGIRHGVMSTAADDLDGPVLVFTSLAVALALGVGVWCNFFYGWYFSQTFVVLLAPAMLVAYILVLLLSKTWHFQPLHTDFKTQISFACLGLVAAMMVLTAVATAVSTRLGQVMTIVACSGVFLFGLLSNYFIGRYAFSNDPLGRVMEAAPLDPNQEGWPEPGSVYKVTLYSPPTARLQPGDPFYFAPAPDGFPMNLPRFAPFSGDLSRGQDLMNPDTRGLAVQSVNGAEIRVVRFGGAPLGITRPPEKNDYAFRAPSRINVAALGVWSIVPNMHYFWLVDAVSQNQPIPPRHMALVGGYALCQVAAFLALGVVLFQKRDVG